MKIAIIGSGNMGGAIAAGLVANGICDADSVVCTAATEATREKISRAIPGIVVSGDNKAAVAGADWVFICVKPWLVAQVAGEIRNNLPPTAAIVSVASGIDFAFLKNAFVDTTDRALFRVMPNTAVCCGQSMTFVAAENASREQLEKVVEIFDKLGKTRVITEAQMAGAAALASCGIAFAMRYVRAACEGGIELGFRPREVREIVLQTVRGAVDLLEKSGDHIEAEIDRVTTPGGITIRGLNEMEANGFSNSVIKGLKAAKQ